MQERIIIISIMHYQEMHTGFLSPECLLQHKSTVGEGNNTHTHSLEVIILLWLHLYYKSHLSVLDNHCHSLYTPAAPLSRSKERR